MMLLTHPKTNSNEHSQWHSHTKLTLHSYTLTQAYDDTNTDPHSYTDTLKLIHILTLIFTVKHACWQSYWWSLTSQIYIHTNKNIDSFLLNTDTLTLTYCWCLYLQTLTLTHTHIPSHWQLHIDAYTDTTLTLTLTHTHTHNAIHSHWLSIINIHTYTS